MHQNSYLRDALMRSFYKLRLVGYNWEVIHSANLVVMEDVIDSSEDRNVISTGTICKYLGMDSDGDVIIQTGVRKRIIFLEDLDKLSLR